MLALAIGGASVTAWLSCRADSAASDSADLGRGARPQISGSCHTGYISQNQNGISTFTPGAHTDANGYKVTFTNSKKHSRTVQVTDVGIAFYDSSGKKFASDTPAFGTKNLAPAHSASVIFYDRGSGFAIFSDPAPRNWVSDGHMPSGATRCQVDTWTVGWSFSSGPGRSSIFGGDPVLGN